MKRLKKMATESREGYIEKRYISVFKPQLARKLLKLGNNIYDIKADKSNTDRTIFIFKNTEKIKRDLTTITK